MGRNGVGWNGTHRTVAGFVGGYRVRTGPGRGFHVDVSCGIVYLDLR